MAPPSGGQRSDNDTIFRLPPYHYMHILDLNTNVTRVEIGPQTYIRQDNERVVVAPERMIVVPPRHYCIVKNPVVVDGTGTVQKDPSGQVKLAHADQAIRLQRDPFPLYPGEILATNVTALVTVPANSALRLKSVLDFEDGDDTRVAGDEWLFEGPGTYVPRKEVVVEETIRATVIRPNQALKLRARRDTTDREGNARVTGEEWLVPKVGAYLPGAYEEVVDVVNAYILTEKKALHMKASRTFRDQFGIVRKSGEEWLVKMADSETYIPGVYEEGTVRQPGDRWMIRGPVEYVPPVEVEVLHKRSAIPLDENEGIYVRDIKNGKVRAVVGETYMLTHDEELWAKELPPAVEALLTANVDPMADRSDRDRERQVAKRDKTRVVSYRVPHNAAVQIYDFKEKKARVIFGPDLVMLRPDEHFTQLSLSGGKPKRPNVIKSLCLLLGPDFMTDIITVETADHARLQLQLAYNWHFNTGDRSQAVAEGLFSVPDFVGDACKAIASRVRGMVAQVQFDDFHKNSARIIRTAVFGMDEHSKVRSQFAFQQNNLVMTSVDIQSVEPVDQRTRDSLQKSVTLAIEITTNSQEASARHEAERLEQEARGKLERQKITDEAAAERSRKELLELQAQSAAVESSGQAKAEAQSRAEAAKIEGEAAVEQARLKAEASKIQTEAELDRLQRGREAELRYDEERNKLEVVRSRELASIETKKFQDMVGTIGADNLRLIASAGPEMQVKLLQALGLKSTLITDGTTPINLFNTAHGLIGGLMGGGQGDGPTTAIMRPSEVGPPAKTRRGDARE